MGAFSLMGRTELGYSVAKKFTSQIHQKWAVSKEIYFDLIYNIKWSGSAFAIAVSCTFRFWREVTSFSLNIINVA